MLWLCLHLPNLAVEVFTRASPAPEPLVVSDGPGREPQVLRANAAAARLGVTPGMRVSAALALARPLRVLVRDPRAERDALDRLAAWAGQFSSLVHPVAPQELLLEVGGSLRLFRNLENLLTQIELGIAELGYTAQLAVAPTRLAATWLARDGGDAQVTEPARLADALAGLPLTVLGLEREPLGRLHGMGVTRLGDCLRLPREGLAKRLGPEFVQQLDRALGCAPDPRAPFVPAARFDARLELPGTVENVQGVVFALNRLVLDLCGELRSRGAGVMRLTLRLTHPKAPATTLRLALVAPTRDPKHLIELFRERLAQVVLPEPVETITLQAAEHLPLGTPNLDLFRPRQESEENAVALIERLRARLGAPAVHGLRVVSEHRPERAYAYDSAPRAAGEVVAGSARPFWLLPEPLPLKLDGERPWLGGALDLEDGAERIESGWWDGADIGRDYFVARNGVGECYWIFRELHGARRWWLHGIFG